jgi:hypothetical protein
MGPLTIDHRYLQTSHVSNSSTILSKGILTEIPRPEFLRERHIDSMTCVSSYLCAECVGWCGIEAGLGSFVDGAS